jgi:TetR/AcrR family transcriptional repressor of mexJK operon
LQGMGESMEVAKAEPVPYNGMDHHPTCDLDNLLETFLSELEKLPRKPRQARSARTREALLKQALRLFSQQGYGATSADAIARAAHVSVGSFYNYFRDKRQILLVLVVERLESIFMSLQFGSLDFSFGKERDVIHATIREVLSPEAMDYRRIWMEFVAHAPDLQGYQDAVRRTTLKKIQERLRLVADEGLTWPDLDIEAAALSIFALLEALSLNYIGSPPEDRLMDGVTDFIYRAVFRPGSAAKRSPGKPHKRS